MVDRSPYLTVTEVAALLNVHRQLIYRMVRQGELPGTLRVGRHIRIPRTAVDALRASVA